MKTRGVLYIVWGKFNEALLKGRKSLEKPSSKFARGGDTVARQRQFVR